jgi:hypothetical protein
MSSSVMPWANQPWSPPGLRSSNGITPIPSAVSLSATGTSVATGWCMAPAGPMARYPRLWMVSR